MCKTVVIAVPIEVEFSDTVAHPSESELQTAVDDILDSYDDGRYPYCTEAIAHHAELLVHRALNSLYGRAKQPSFSSRITFPESMSPG